MSLIDFILNLAALLLWLNWRAAGFFSVPAPGVSLATTLRKAEPDRSKRWWWLATLAGLLLVRPFFYFTLGSTADWVARLRLGVTTLVFRSDRPDLMLWFSLFSFITLFVAFHVWLLLLSVVNRQFHEPNPEQKLVRLHLGWLEYRPTFVKLLLPLEVVTLLWVAWHPLLVQLGRLPPTTSTAHVWAQGLLMGLGVYTAVEPLVSGLLLLHMLNSYVYLGPQSFWKFVDVSAGNFLGPLRKLPLRVGRVDLAPLLGVALVWLTTHWGLTALTALFQRVP